MAGQEDSHKISRVHRSKEEAKKTYDRISTVYNWLGGIFERRPIEKALSYLKVESGWNGTNEFLWCSIAKSFCGNRSISSTRLKFP